MCDVLTKFQGNYWKMKILRKLIGTIFEVLKNLRKILENF